MKMIIHEISYVNHETSCRSDDEKHDTFFKTERKKVIISCKKSSIPPQIILTDIIFISLSVKLS